MTRRVQRDRKRRPGYRRPGVHEPRQVQQPFLLDRLGPAARGAVLRARARGKTWVEVARIVSRIAGRRVSYMACCRWYGVKGAALEAGSIRLVNERIISAWLRSLGRAALVELGRRLDRAAEVLEGQGSRKRIA